MLGDLEEEFALHLAEGGARSARRWYWGQVLRSIGPLLWLRSSGRPHRTALAIALGAVVLVGTAALTIASAVTLVRLIGLPPTVRNALYMIAFLAPPLAAGYVTAALARPRSLAAAVGIALIAPATVAVVLLTNAEAEPLSVWLMWLPATTIATVLGTAVRAAGHPAP